MNAEWYLFVALEVVGLLLDLAASLIYWVLFVVFSILAAIWSLVIKSMWQIFFSFSAAGYGFADFKSNAVGDESKRAEIWPEEIIQAAQEFQLEPEYISYLAEEIKNVPPEQVTEQHVLDMERYWLRFWSGLWDLQHYIEEEREVKPAFPTFFPIKSELFQMPPFMMVPSTGGFVGLY